MTRGLHIYKFHIECTKLSYNDKIRRCLPTLLFQGGLCFLNWSRF